MVGPDVVAIDRHDRALHPLSSLGGAERRGERRGDRLAVDDEPAGHGTFGQARLAAAGNTQTSVLTRRDDHARHRGRELHAGDQRAPRPDRRCTHRRGGSRGAKPSGGCPPSKRSRTVSRAASSASARRAGFFPPADALSGRPPPLPSMMGASTSFTSASAFTFEDRSFVTYTTSAAAPLRLAPRTTTPEPIVSRIRSESARSPFTSPSPISAAT